MSEHRLEVADVFRQHGREFFARWSRRLTAQQRKAFRDICACRTATLGARYERCNHCSHENVRFYPAGIGIALNVNRQPVIDGWAERPKNYCLFPTVMSSSRFPGQSQHWAGRTAL
jgi:hypothetical protein